METIARPRKGGKLKYNWDLVFGDLDSGMPWRAVAEKYSIGERVMYEKMRGRKKAFASEVRKVGFQETREPAPLVKIPQKSGPKPQNYAIEAPSPAELTESQLLSLLSDPQAVLSLSASEAEKLMAKALQLKVSRGLAVMRDPESPKELGPMAKLFREMSGLTGDKGKGGSGLLSPQRAYGRRAMAEGPAIEALEVPDYM